MAQPARRVECATAALLPEKQAPDQTLAEQTHLAQAEMEITEREAMIDARLGALARQRAVLEKTRVARGEESLRMQLSRPAGEEEESKSVLDEWNIAYIQSDIEREVLCVICEHEIRAEEEQPFQAATMRRELQRLRLMHNQQRLIACMRRLHQLR
jgi:hypothetical protein